MCKTCNSPFSDRYYLKGHISKFHNSELSTVSSPCIETNQNKESGNTQTIDDGYTRKLRNLEINQQRNADFVQLNTVNFF